MLPFRAASAKEVGSRVEDPISKMPTESPEFQAGRAEGLRDALAIVEALLAAEELKLEAPAPYVTRTARRTRWQAYRNAASRLRTLLSRMTRGKPMTAEIEARLDRLGL